MYRVWPSRTMITECKIIIVLKIGSKRYDDDMAFPHYCTYVTSGFSSQRATNADLWYLHCFILNKLLKMQSNCRWFETPWRSSKVTVTAQGLTPQIAMFVWPPWDPPGSWRPQVGPTLAPLILLSGTVRTALLWTRQHQPVVAISAAFVWPDLPLLQLIYLAYCVLQFVCSKQFLFASISMEFPVIWYCAHYMALQCTYIANVQRKVRAHKVDSPHHDS